MLPIALKIVMIQGMDNKRTEQNPVELVKNAGEELFQYKKHSPEHNEVFEKYKNELFILLENYRALSNDERIQEKIDSFQKKLIEVMRTLSATDYFDRFDERYKPHPNDPYDIQQQSETHSLSSDTRNKLQDEWDCILQKIESIKKREEVKHQKKSDGDEILEDSTMLKLKASEAGQNIRNVDSGTEQGNKAGKQNKKKKRRKRKIKLTDKQKEIWGSIKDGATVAELATEKKCSLSNIRQQYKKAEEKLKRLNAGSRSINFTETQRIPTDKRGQENIEDKRKTT